MIIICKKCSTSFNLEESLIKEKGSKVCCGICKNVFTVFPAVRENEQKPEDMSMTEPEFDDETSSLSETLSSETLSDDSPGKPGLGPDFRIDKKDTPKIGIKKKAFMNGFIYALIIVFVLVFAAYIAVTLTGYKISYKPDMKIPVIETYFKKLLVNNSSEKAPLLLDQKNLKGKFVTNSKTGTLFVITGTVDNRSEDTSYSHIKIKASIITKDKIKIKTRSVFCGNVIEEKILRTGNIADINRLLTVKNESNTSKVKPGDSIPFMVIFSDPPEKMKNFNIKVIEFDKSAASLSN